MGLSLCVDEVGEFSEGLWSRCGETGWLRSSFASASGVRDSYWVWTIPRSVSALPYAFLSAIVPVTSKSKEDGAGGKSGTPPPASEQQKESISNITLGGRPHPDREAAASPASL